MLTNLILPIPRPTRSCVEQDPFSDIALFQKSQVPKSVLLIQTKFHQPSSYCIHLSLLDCNEYVSLLSLLSFYISVSLQHVFVCVSVSLSIYVSLSDSQSLCLSIYLYPYLSFLNPPPLSLFLITVPTFSLTTCKLMFINFIKSWIHYSKHHHENLQYLHTKVNKEVIV